MVLTNAEIVTQLSYGFTTKEIATNFNVKSKTIEARILNLKKQCNCANTVELVAKYLRNKLID
jgi:DNA-binding NarL/FixJ family response regulator